MQRLRSPRLWRPDNAQATSAGAPQRHVLVGGMVLPFPRSWVQRTLEAHPDSVSEVPLLDLALSAKNPKVNTKAMLRIKLLGSGWDPAVVSLVTKDDERPDLAVVDIATKGVAPQNLSNKRSLLRAAGFEVKSQKTGPSAASILWRSLTHVSPWLVDKFSRRLIIATGTHTMNIQRASAGFIVDCWRGQNADENSERMPRFARFNLLSWMSPDALQKWTDVTKNLDIAVVYGGFHEEADLHRVLGYLTALADSFHGFVIYELFLPTNVTPQWVESAARRHSVALVCQYTAKLMQGEGELNGE